MNENIGTVIRPYSLPLSLDYIDFDSSYIIDNGEFINLFIFDQNKPEFYESVFYVNDFSQIDLSKFEQLDESNESDINVRLLNLINQMRTDNRGVVQPLRIFFINEKSVMKDELTNLLCEDQYRDEPFYVDYLADVHSKIQGKMNH